MNLKEANNHIKNKCIEHGLPIIPVKVMNAEEQDHNCGLFSPYLIAVKLPVSKTTLNHEFAEYILALYFVSADAKEKILG